MKIMRILYKLFLVLSVVMFASCEDKLTELNVNPQGVNPETVNPNLLLTTVITSAASSYLKAGYDGGSAGVMQYVQKSGWGSSLNKYEWNSEADWDGFYANLRNLQHMYNRSVEEDMEFHQGVAIVLRAFTFAYIADWWGDAPYTTALKGSGGAQEDLFPVFDTQETIYRGIIEELKTANTLLSKSLSEYKEINPDADVIYGGDPAKWRMMANSLMLRFYMRVSTKLPSYARDGINEIIGDVSTYPIFTSIDDDATMSYPGTYGVDAWPNAVAFDASESNFNRLQLCAGFRDVLIERNDPRLDVWFDQAVIPIKVSTAQSPNADIIVGGIRYIHPDSMPSRDWVIYNKDTWPADIEAGKVLVDTNNYPGMPIASSTGDGSGWNLNPNVIQGGPNVHNSQLDAMYKEASGDLLLARLMSYAEVCFIRAEAAQKTWAVGSQQEWYEKGVTASFETWDIGGDASDYLAEAGVAYDGSLEQLMEQKWIANWTNATEAHCDWRRTGFPALTLGPIATRDAMPLRAMYGNNEKNRNNTNYLNAIENLVETEFTAQDGKDSAWSKFWLLQ